MILRILLTGLKIFVKWRAGRSAWMAFTSMTGEMTQTIVTMVFIQGLAHLYPDPQTDRGCDEGSL